MKWIVAGDVENTNPVAVSPEALAQHQQALAEFFRRDAGPGFTAIVIHRGPSLLDIAQAVCDELNADPEINAPSEGDHT